ncbi:hypothetical protein F5148DRAFT_1278386 [Russula earlei]|uniref:Uncharacterized protein n=1 Tax=Russula earlei TaxID=71964 RepID=A0ACC0TUG9_9AGAM|nr:hypothetical protein F5148DRAFT_1278386 [Russula earlei]
MGQKCTWEHAPEPGERPAHRVREDGRRTSEGVDGSGSESDDEGDVTVGENFCEAEDLFDLLRARCSASNYVDFHGTYPVKEDPLISPKQHVMMVAQEVWQLTGYRFMITSQDEAHKKKAKPSCKPGVKHLDHIRMKRYPCQSHLVITCIQKKAGPLHVMIILQHHMKHVLYLDVSMPSEALKMIEEQVKWLTPSAMASRVQASYPQVTSKQICKAWRELSQLQLPSARKLLAEYPEEADLFDVSGIPENMEIITWGIKKIVTPLKDHIVEIGMDATYNTNTTHLELYNLMAEHNNAGFPLSYCLISTAAAIDQGKRTNALAAWANLCWWHLRRALATMPYNIKRACQEFDFIDDGFFPQEPRLI